MSGTKSRDGSPPSQRNLGLGKRPGLRRFLQIQQWNAGTRRRGFVAVVVIGVSPVVSVVMAWPAPATHRRGMAGLLGTST